MFSKKIALILILMGMMAIPWNKGQAGPGQQIAPGQGIPNLEFLGVWLCRSHRSASATLSATAFRPVNYTFNADGTMMNTTATPINSGAAGNPQLDSGFGARNAGQAEWEKCDQDTIHFENRLEFYSAGKGLTGNAGGKQVVKTDATLFPGADPTYGDVLQTHSDFYTTRYKFRCLLNGNPLAGEYCTVAGTNSPTTVKCTTAGATCEYSGEIQGEEVFQSGTADSACVRLAKGIDATFDQLPNPDTSRSVACP